MTPVQSGQNFGPAGLTPIQSGQNFGNFQASNNEVNDFGSDEYANYGDYGDETTPGTVDSTVDGTVDSGSFDGSEQPLASGITSPPKDLNQPAKTADNKFNPSKPLRPNNTGSFGSSGNLRPSGNNPNHSNQPQSTTAQQTGNNGPQKLKPAGVAHDDHSFGYNNYFRTSSKSFLVFSRAIWVALLETSETIRLQPVLKMAFLESIDQVLRTDLVQ